MRYGPWIQGNLRKSDVVKTLCQGVDNRIVDVKPGYIVVRSSRGKRDRTLLKDDFQYAFSELVRRGSINRLDDVPRIRGRRATVLAILSLTPYVCGKCVGRRRVHVTLCGSKP